MLLLTLTKEKMKTSLGILLAILLVTMSCDEEDIVDTGNIVVVSGDVTAVDQIPIGQLRVGLFDISVLLTNRFSNTEAIGTGYFYQGKVEFKEILPGNYVVALISSTNFRQAVQVTAGESVTADLFK